MSVTVDGSGAFREHRGLAQRGLDRRRVERRGRARIDSRSRPAGFVSYGRARVPVSAAPHRAARDGAGLSAMLLGVLGSAFAVVVLVGLGWSGPQSLPTETAVVQVRGGESLGQLAARVAPAAPVGRMVTRIVELNGLAGVGVQAGQSLVVPVDSVG
ncbi:LysM peptidoglycan-binding domain-containing protein [Rhodococcus kronopolitis]|uniref:LysM peptidoglycan-binding domain-containing protein n=1 Tax=Rhodococcus kronopolitis TaxID=1460226 RepID=A0ABV9FRG4_9NOCA